MPDIISLLTNTIQGALTSKESRVACWNLNQTLQISLGFVIVSSLVGMASTYFSPMAFFKPSMLEMVITQLILPIGYYFAMSYLLFAWVKSAKTSETFTLQKVQQTLAQGIILTIAANLIALVSNVIGLSFIGMIATLVLVVLSCMFMCKTLADNLKIGAWGVFFRLFAIGILVGLVGAIVMSVLGLNSSSNFDTSNPEGIMDMQSGFMEKIMEQSLENSDATPEEIAEAKEMMESISKAMLEAAQEVQDEQ